MEVGVKNILTEKKNRGWQMVKHHAIELRSIIGYLNLLTGNN